MINNYNNKFFENRVVFMAGPESSNAENEEMVRGRLTRMLSGTESVESAISKAESPDSDDSCMDDLFQCASNYFDQASEYAESLFGSKAEAAETRVNAVGGNGNGVVDGLTSTARERSAQVTQSAQAQLAALPRAPQNPQAPKASVEKKDTPIGSLRFDESRSFIVVNNNGEETELTGSNIQVFSATKTGDTMKVQVPGGFIRMEEWEYKQAFKKK